MIIRYFVACELTSAIKNMCYTETMTISQYKLLAQLALEYGLLYTRQLCVDLLTTLTEHLPGSSELH